jgi:hypothetical protein
MSKMGAFVLECQTIAQDCYNESREDVIAEVEKTFVNADKFQVSYAKEVTLEYWEEIQSDMRTYF